MGQQEIRHATTHPLQPGDVFFSPGCHFSYRVIGPCCRLFDREQLPWPCCRLQWRGKEPSWRRVGRRFVVDLATKNSPSYSVEILGQSTAPITITLYSVKLSKPVQDWWHSDRLKQPPALPTSVQTASVTCATNSGAADETTVEG